MRKIINKICNDNKLSIDMAFNNFISLKKSEGRRSDTIRSYNTSIKDFKKYCSANNIIDIHDINKSLIEKYKEHLIELDIANTDANEPFARRIQTSETVDLNQGNGRLSQAKQRQAIQYNWIKPH